MSQVASRSEFSVPNPARMRVRWNEVSGHVTDLLLRKDQR